MNITETIQSRTLDVLESGGSLMGQCITAVGWIQNTVPPHAPNLVELPMNDVSGPGLAIGSALTGKRTILVLRFQSLLWLASNSIVNYAAKCRDVWDQDCPLLIRAIAAEHTGPIHSNCNHNIFMGIPGLKMVSPMTSNEVNAAWDNWENGSDPVLFSEHRRSYTEEMPIRDIFWENPDVTIFACSASRIEAIKASEILGEEGYNVAVIGIIIMQPWHLSAIMEYSVNKSKYTLSMDSSYIPGGIAEHVAYKVMHRLVKR